MIDQFITQNYLWTFARREVSLHIGFFLSTCLPNKRNAMTKNYILTSIYNTLKWIFQRKIKFGSWSFAFVRLLESLVYT